MQIHGIRIRAQIGSLELLRLPRMKVSFERHKPVSRAEIEVPSCTPSLREQLAIGTQITLHFGYRDEQPGQWSGTISKAITGYKKDQICVHAVGLDRVLKDCKICQSWENESAEAIARWSLHKTGLPVAQIDAPGVILPRFVASNIPVWQLVQQLAATCERAFAKDMSHWALWLGTKGLNWGDFDESGDTPVIETGKGLITHKKGHPQEGTLHCVETFLLPNMRHSMRFALIDAMRGESGEYRAQKVVQSIQPNKARTFLYYSER